MSTLVDTGVLLRAFDSHAPHYREIRNALRAALDRNVRLAVAVQNIAEFWNVATRPLDKNGQGLSTDKVKRRVAIIERLCDVLAEDQRSYAEWKRLVEKHHICGVAVHDARLVSVMLSFAIDEVLTLNERDFQRYAGEGIRVASPQAFAESL